MGIVLTDPGDDDRRFDANFWHWRAIVEAVRATGALPAARVDRLHEPFVGELTAAEARAVAAAIRATLLPTLAAGERLLLDGRRITEPDDRTFHKAPEDFHKNYGTDRATLEAFAAFCEECDGFSVG